MNIISEVGLSRNPPFRAPSAKGRGAFINLRDLYCFFNLHGNCQRTVCKKSFHTY